MKNTFAISFGLSILILTFLSCNTYHSIETASNVRQLSANPFAKKVARSVLHNISENIIDKNLTSFKGKPLLASRLSAILNTPQSITVFKDMISNIYGIPPTLVENNYNSWDTVRDVIAFVATKGQRYDFTSYSNKLL